MYERGLVGQRYREAIVLRAFCKLRAEGGASKSSEAQPSKCHCNAPDSQVFSPRAASSTEWTGFFALRLPFLRRYPDIARRPGVTGELVELTRPSPLSAVLKQRPA